MANVKEAPGIPVTTYNRIAFPYLLALGIALIGVDFFDDGDFEAHFLSPGALSILFGVLMALNSKEKS